MHAKTVAIFVSLTILCFVIELIRRQKMTFKYSMFWLIICGAVGFFSINDRLLKKISTFFGFELLSNFVFFLLLVFFIFVCLLLTIYANEQSNRSDSLAQSVGILEYKINELNKKTDKSANKKNSSSES